LVTSGRATDAILGLAICEQEITMKITLVGLVVAAVASTTVCLLLRILNAEIAARGGGVTLTPANYATVGGIVAAVALFAIGTRAKAKERARLAAGSQR
jgi:hypothetical protein